MGQRRLVIAGTGSGVGKTTVTVGLMAALKQQGYTVQGFKCGPDYIDPTYHTAVTGRASRNVDSWMLQHNTVKEIYQRGSVGADISIIEGVMGFYDGKDPLKNTGSTAEISQLLQSPVLLVVNCASMARSAAAIVKGFQTLSEGVNIAGVFANQVGSEGHYKLVKAAIEQECDVPVIGYMKREADIDMPERHLGLVPAIERGELDAFFQSLGNRLRETVNIDLLLEIATAPPVEPEATNLLFHPSEQERDSSSSSSVSIAIARDAAFNFYYPENLELLQQYGADLVEFSPLRGETLPDGIDGLYLGGGFPEEFVSDLAKNTEVKASIRQAIKDDLPTLAECGGFMYLTDSIETTDQDVYEMVGVIPGRVTMQTRLAALGYREVTGIEPNFLLPQGMSAKGHEFHYSTFTANSSTDHFPYAYTSQGLRGLKQEGYVLPHLVAGYTHLHFASNPSLVKHWIRVCQKRKRTKAEQANKS
ncbi:cobyrinate a,c-diamide synthase [Caldalkalibacillus salinus]|uniref:cobyrinate a,c-diamide synthase n=1 Tax=Caldalkalibacillus salinus TaxID=2803787 RepID=UPI001921E20E|nr:cobyrinate a,c-diamide synthase [Caldalkalibacillus salinus]